MKSLLCCRDPDKAGQNFIPAKRDHVITPLVAIHKGYLHITGGEGVRQKRTGGGGWLAKCGRPLGKKL